MQVGLMSPNGLSERAVTARTTLSLFLATGPAVDFQLSTAGFRVNRTSSYCRLPRR